MGTVSWRDEREKRRQEKEREQQQDAVIAEIREERSASNRKDLWAMAEHVRNMVIDLRSWIYWIGFDKSLIPEENIVRAYEDIDDAIERLMQQAGVRKVTLNYLEELKYELNNHREIFMRRGAIDQKNEGELRKSSDRIIGLENSMRHSFHNSDYEWDNIG
ncbi:MAG: hypothetical protein QXU18_00280 [Thermoplasmatales archaeon]